MFQSIVVAVDGSEPATRALQAACALARAFGSELHLVHARERARSDKSPQPAGDAGSTQLNEARAFAEKEGVTPSSATAVTGDPFDEIMTIAGLYGADLIVTGRRGLGNISGMFAGSTTQQIAKHAQCAHLSVK
jgi:nucleotide-binding universal stress UspA family protein